MTTMRVLLMYPPSQTHLEALHHAAPQAEFVSARSEAEARCLIEDAEVVLGNRYFLQSLPCARRLRWMQSNSVGVDLILTAKEVLHGITLTCARGVYDGEMAEHALALLLGLTRSLHKARDQQHSHLWQCWSLNTMEGKRCLVLGWGGVARRLAQILAVMGVRVDGVRRSAIQPCMDEQGFMVWTPTTWRDRLPETDFLVLSLPLTKETHHLVGAQELNLLPSHALLVNIGRGGTVDEEALIAALRNGRLAGAGLDVVENEPLPPDHPLWEVEKLLLTPHVARSKETPPYRWEPLFVENMRRYAAGEPLLNVVDQDAGY